MKMLNIDKLYLINIWHNMNKFIACIQPLMPTFLVPLFTTLIIGVAYVYLLVYPLNGFVQLMVHTLTGLSGTNAALLGIGIGILAAADMGGPCSKAATAFTLALMAEGIYGPNGAFRLCCDVPHLGLALSTFIIRNRFTQEERQFGISALFLSMAGITEGAIPFAGKDFKRILPAIIIGTSVSGLLGMIHGVESVVAISGVTKGALWYAVDMIIGSLVIVGYLFLTRTKLEVNAIK